ncbi:MAG: DNA adenine methylase [Planctomycetota bacterium]|nr:DNA adenine methylase [Planctomycetota bacterium]
MGKTILQHESLFPALTGTFPSTRYQGSKAKVADWIWERISGLDFKTCLDAFGGTGVVAYHLKQAGKQVTYNDLLRFNYYIGLALIENSCVRLNPEKIDWILDSHPDITYPRIVQDNFQDIYFTDDENAWIDRTITNIRQLSDPYEFAMAFFALCQACIIKRPYNLFHRKNLYIRLADVDRSFGNKTTWDRPFDELFRSFVVEANRAVFDNGSRNSALNYDAVNVSGDYDLIYVDTPYIPKRGAPVDYFGFYHFLEGLTMYDYWCKHIDFASKHHRLNPRSDKWTDKKQIPSAFNELFKRFQNSIIVVSYRSDGIPSVSELCSLLGRYKSDVQLMRFGQYQYVLSTNSESEEILLIGT